MSEAWMKRLIFQAYCFVIGVVVGKIHPVAHTLIPFLFGLFALLLTGSLFAFVAARRGRLPVIAAVFLFGISCFFLGWGRFSQKFMADDPAHISKFTSHSWKDRASVEGIITTDPEVFGERVTFTLNPLRVKREGSESEFEEISDGLVEITIRREAKDLYQQFSLSEVYGWRIRVNAPLLKPPPELNPHGFSYRDFLADQDIYAVQTIAAEWGTPPPIEVLDQGEGFFLTEFALSIKEKIMGVFVQTIPYPQSTFLAGVTLGIKAALDQTRCIVAGHEFTVNDECRVAGVSHVLAVSGQHVTIISGMFLAIFTALKIPMRIQAPLIIVALFIFTIITGMPPSALRATIMNSLALFFLAMSRGSFQSSLMFGIAEAAFIVLFVNPKNIVQPGFTLSFAAVLSLGLISFPLENLLKKLRGVPFLYFIFSVLFVSVITTHAFYDRIDRPSAYVPLAALIAAGFFWCKNRFPPDEVLGNISYERLHVAARFFIVAQGAVLIGMMYPLSSYYFGRFSLAGPVANMIAIPLTGVIVPLGLLAGLIGMLPGPGMFVALILNATNDVLCKVFFYTAHYSTVTYPYPFIENMTTGRLGLYYAAIAVFVWWEPLYKYGLDVYYKYYKHAEDPAIRRNVAGMVMVGGSLILFVAAKAWIREPELAAGRMRMTFLSTSFGNSAVLQTPTGKTYLIDGGLNNRETLADVGQRTIAPFLLKQGISHLDGVILTSATPEHTEGLASLLGGFDVDKFYDAVPIVKLDQFVELRKKNPEKAYAGFLNVLNDPYLKSNRDAPHIRRMYESYGKLADIVIRRGIPRVRAESGRVVEKTRVDNLDLRIAFLAPDERLRDHRDQSAVLKIEYGSFSVLWTADIGEHGIASLIGPGGSRGSLVESDVLVLPDHGQKPAARHPDLVRAVNCSVAVAQSGNFKLLYGKSREAKPLVDQAKEDYDANIHYFQENLGDAQVFDSQKDGAVILETDGKKYSVRSMKEKSKS